MAYNYYPYHPQWNQQAFAQNYQPQAQQPMQQQTFPAQSFGFVTVRSEEEARAYPVAPNNSVSFRNELAPYVYTKSMGASPLDSPSFEKFRLVKEDDAPPAADAKEGQNERIEYATKSELDALRADFAAFKASIKEKPKKRKAEEDEDDE